MHEFTQIQKYYRASSDMLGILIGTLGTTVRNAVAGRTSLPGVKPRPYYRLALAVQQEVSEAEAYQPVPEEVADLRRAATRQLVELNFKLLKTERQREVLLERRRVAYTGYAACPALLADPQDFTERELWWIDHHFKKLAAYLWDRLPLQKLARLDARLRALQAEKAYWQDLLLEHSLPTSVPNLNPTFDDLRADREAREQALRAMARKRAGQQEPQNSLPYSMGFLSRILKGQTPREAVWEWLAEHEEQLIALASAQKHLPDYDQAVIQERLKAVHPHLDYRLMGPSDGGEWYLILTVGGDAEALHVLDTMAAEAPTFRRFRVLKGLPPVEHEGIHHPAYNLTLRIDELCFKAEPLGEDYQVPRINILVPKLLTHEGMEHLAHMVLYNYLGEYTYAQLLEYLMLYPREGSNVAPYRPLAELRDTLLQFGWAQQEQ